ncbi:MAG TPA: hypothetical protein VFE50_25075 [Cyclobacteriaceae bacterium]|nr:hypothetical protein [Cyclobacteriaceae bacterium]
MEIEPTYNPTITDSYFYLQNGKVLKQGDNKTWMVKRSDENLPGFTAMQPISKKTAVLRVIDINARKNLLSRSDSPRSTKDILTTQVDGILCTDGYLNYSESEHTLVYTYRYRNQFICLDTGLNVLFIGKTIDTTSVAKITVAEANGKITMSSPPFIVNMGTCVDGKYLFVHSNLVASNQSPDAIEDRSFIDVYNINDGSYLLSFYIYHVNDLKMRSFIVKDDALFAEFPGYVAKYNLALKHLTD